MENKYPSILICGTRRSDLLEAEQLIRSIRLHYQTSIEIILYTSFKDYSNEELNEIVLLENPYYGFMDKLVAINHVKRERFLFLDSDTFLVDRIDELFTLLNEFDIALAHAPNRWTHKLSSIPDSYPEFNTGVILIKKSEAVTFFLKNWVEKYSTQLETKIILPSGDQPSFRELLYFSTLRVATLTPEYNCRFSMGTLVSHKVKILHGRSTNFKKILTEINKSPKMPWHDEPGIRYKFYDEDAAIKKSLISTIFKIVKSRLT